MENKRKPGRPRKNDDEKVDPSEKITCLICGYKYQRRNKTRHQRTKICMMHCKLNNRIKKYILPDDEPNSISIAEFRSMKILNKLNSIDNFHKCEEFD